MGEDLEVACAFFGGLFGLLVLLMPLAWYLDRKDPPTPRQPGEGYCAWQRRHRAR